MQGTLLSQTLPGSSQRLCGQPLTLRRQPLLSRRSQPGPCRCSTQLPERLRLDNLSPQPGSKFKKNRIGRGYGAGQGGTCGDGMRGQKARSGSTPKPGFEGGQMPLYRRLPKLRGIAGGMKKGEPKFVTINVGELGIYEEGETVNLETLAEKNLLTSSGRESRLPLKILGNGDLISPLKISAVEFSQSAREKIEKAGGTIDELPAKVRWTRQIGAERKEAAAAQKQPETPAKPAAKPAKK